MSDWHQFLTSEGAIWQDGTLLDFNAQKTNAQYWLVPMQDHKIVKVSGPDAIKFLQGQLTCDLKQLDDGTPLLGAHCNAKGRMISSFMVAKAHDQALQLRVRADNVERAIAALKKYIVFSKATIQIDDTIPFALLPKTPQSELELACCPKAGLYASSAKTTCLHHENGLVELWVSPNEARALWLQCKHEADLAGLNTLNDYWIEAGVTEVAAATAEEFIPQMLNFDLLNGINFKKGCYTGQEIIARLHYRGQTKKRTYLCKPATQLPHIPTPIGCNVYSNGDSEKIIGIVVASSTKSLLVTANSEHFESKTPLLLRDQSHIILEWATQPYAIP